MPIPDPIRLEYVQVALGQMVEGWFGSDIAAVRWKNQNAARPPYPFVELGWVAWPTRLAHPVRRVLEATAAAVANLEGTLDSTERRTVWINGRPHHGEGADGNAIAAALAAAITSSPEPATATATGATTVSIVSGEVGGIGSIRGGPNVSIGTTTSELIAEKSQRMRGVVSFSAFAKQAARSPSAGQIAAAMASQLTEPATLDLLRYARIGMTSMSPTRDLSGVSTGPEIEARVQFDVGVLLESRTASAATAADRLILSNASTHPPQETEIDL